MRVATYRGKGVGIGVMCRYWAGGPYIPLEKKCINVFVATHITENYCDS